MSSPPWRLAEGGPVRQAKMGRIWLGLLQWGALPPLTLNMRQGDLVLVLRFRRFINDRGRVCWMIVPWCYFLLGVWMKRDWSLPINLYDSLIQVSTSICLLIECFMFFTRSIVHCNYFGWNSYYKSGLYVTNLLIVYCIIWSLVLFHKHFFQCQITMILTPIVHGTNSYFCNKVLIHAYGHIMKLYSASTHVSTLICLTGSFYFCRRGMSRRRGGTMDDISMTRSVVKIPGPKVIEDSAAVETTRYM